eukprot:gene7963-8606_t
MGAAASTLNGEDAGKVTKDLKQRYEQLVEEKMTDAEIQEKLTKEYAKLVEEISKHQKPSQNNHQEEKKLLKLKGSKDQNDESSNIRKRGSKDAADETSLNAIKRKGSRDNGDDNRSVRLKERVTSPSMKSGSHKGAVDDLTSKASARLAAKGSGKHPAIPSTRRRSFDSNQALKKPAPAVPAVEIPILRASSHDNLPGSQSPKKSDRPPLTESSSEAALPTASSDILDSWDSVTQQPYCKICQMAFKSEAFLERHIKFSDLHTQNVKKANGELEPPKLAEENNTVPPNASIANITKQVEGEHYKLLYTGSKFFWRTQDTYDLHFYLHILPNCIEIISYDTVKSKETNRIYLDYDRLVEIIKKNPNITWNPEDEEANRNAVTTFILQRLQLSSSVVDTTSSSITGNILVFTRLTGDDFNPDPKSPYNQRTPVLEKAPIVLIPINVTRRRRTNAEEIEATITGLTNDRAALVAATNRAEKVAHLVYAGATAIATKKWYADLNPIRKRWIWAIRRVIRQKLVAVTTQYLRELELKVAQELRAGKRNSMILPTKSKEI